MNEANIRLLPFAHNGRSCLGLHFKYNQQWIEIAKSLSCHWSQTNRCWYTEHTPGMKEKIFRAFKGIAWVDASALYGGTKVKRRTLVHDTQAKAETDRKAGKNNKQVPIEFVNLLKERRYSQATISTYTSLFKEFVNYFDKPLADITDKEIKDYLLHTIEKKKASYSTQNQIINSIKFFYEQVLGQERKKYWINRPRKEKKLPVVASEDEVVRLVVAANNLKHQCIIALLYSTGLRRGELINLRIYDIDFDRKQVFVRGGKGKKDRVTIIGNRMIHALTKYLEKYKPHYWLFEGAGRKQYSGTSIGKVVKEACKRANIRKMITPHVLRHSFATHLMDKGTDTRYIQELLGHSSLQTTAIYAHVSTKDLQKIINPLDAIDIDNKLNDKYLT